MRGPSPGPPGYVLETALGRGAMGTVHRARRAGWAGRVVALKRVPRGGRDLAAALRSEAEALAALDHPHIVRILDLVPDGDGVAIAMQYAPGGSLEALLCRRGRLGAGEVVAVAAPLADALASAHRRGLLHCDVKPANVVFTSDGEPLLCDFGLARRVASTAAGGRPPARRSGTAGYLDPAVAAARGPDERSDVYSLGVVCYEMLAGRPPFEGATTCAVLEAAAAGAFDPLASAAPGTPSLLAAAVERALARRPDDRFATAAGFGSALRAAVPHARSPLAPADPTTCDVAEGPPASHPSGRLPPAGPAVAASHPSGCQPAAPLAPAGPAVDPRHPSCFRPPASPTSGPFTVPSEPPAGPAGTSDQPGPHEPECRHHRPTRSFGPRPPLPADAPPAARGRGRPRLVRTPVLVGVAAALAAAGALVAGAGPGPQRPEVVTLAATRPAGAGCEPVGSPLRADLDGDGCDTAVSWRGNVAEAAGVRYHLGRPGDVLLLGDWDCDRRDTPALYRPVTGQVFIFPAWADQGPALAGTDAGRHPAAGGATVVRGPEGCDQVVVAAHPTAGAPRS